MADLSSYSDEDLMQIAVPSFWSSSPAASMGDEELMKIAGIPSKASEGVLARAHREGTEAFSSSVESAAKVPTTDSAIEGVGGLLSAIGVPFSYPMGVAGSLLGSGMSAALEGAGHVINKGEALLGGDRFVNVPSQNEIYQKVRPEMDTALMGMGARGAVPIPKTGQIGSIAKQQYDDVLARSKYVPVSDPEFAAMSQGAARDLNAAGMRPAEFPGVHAAVRDISNPEVNDLAEMVSRRRALNDLPKGEGVAIGATRKRMMSDIESIDPISAEKLMAADKEWTVFNKAKDVDKFIAQGKRAENFDVSGTLRRNFKKIVDNPDKMKRYSPEEQELIEGLAGGKYNMLNVLGKLDPRRGGLMTMLHGGLGYATGGISAGASALGFAAQVLSNRMALSKANKLGELIRSGSGGMQKVTGPMEEWGKAALAFQTDPSPRNFARLSLSSTNFSNNLASIGIDFSRSDLLRAIPAASRAEDED
jgi:hypothetical protein